MGVRAARRRAGAALAVDPAGVAVEVVLFLPDRHALLDLVDDVAGRKKCLVAVRGAGAHPHRHLADGEIPESMRAGGARHAEAADRLCDDALPLAQRERLVLQVLHLRAVAVIAHPALEASEAAAARIGERAAQTLAVDRGVAEAKAAHDSLLSRQPPAG